MIKQIVIQYRTKATDDITCNYISIYDAVINITTKGPAAKQPDYLHKKSSESRLSGDFLV